MARVRPDGYDAGMGVDQVPFGVLLRRWRERRRMTQMDLAAAANSSTRHLSCLETGRAQPSREMALRLAERLEIPLRDRNALLLGAGFAPNFRERSISELTSAQAAMERVLDAHKPYPAFAVDRHWNVVLSNGALPQLYADCAPALLRRPVNAVRLILHPDGLGPKIINFEEWRGHVAAVLRQQLAANGDSRIRALLAEVVAYPARAAAAPPASFEGADEYATPLQIATRAGPVSFVNTTTVFGTPTDVTLSELALEMLFPADDSTVATVKRLMNDDEARLRFERAFAEANSATVQAF
jgi:transcriptional regulator with XRE-family HTH domain